jgi:hypothetical protein
MAGIKSIGVLRGLFLGTFSGGLFVGIGVALASRNDHPIMRQKPDPQTIREWSAKAEVHPRTLDRFLRGDKIRALSRRRIVRAAAVLGLPLPKAAPPSRPA